MLHIVQGDLLKATREGKIQHMAHGANCWSTMGAGIAGIIARDFPELYEADKTHHLLPEQRLGRFSEANLKCGAKGYNLYTQNYPGPHARLDMIKSSLTLVAEHIAEEMVPEEVTYLGFPALGCGIGGLQFLDMGSVVEEVSDLLEADYPNKTVVFCLFVMPGQFSSDVELIKSNGGSVVNSPEEIGL